MAGLKDRLTGLRADHPRLDRVVAAVEQYNVKRGAQKAGSVTYFGFLSFFPILALAFFVVGKMSIVYPAARENLVEAINEVLPIFAVRADDGGGAGGLTLDTFSEHATTLGLIGVVGVLYSGLGWLSSLREALMVMLDVPMRDKPSFVVGKLRDLLSLVVLGLILLLSVAVAGFVSGFSAEVLDFLGLGRELGWLVTLGTALLGLVANVLLFLTMFKLLPRPELTTRELLGGAVLGAVGFEALKQGAFLLLRLTENQPAFQVFGISLILLVWIHYFAQLVLFSAGWAATSLAVVARQAQQPAQAPTLVASAGSPRQRPRPVEEPLAPGAAFAAGAAAMLGLTALLRRRRRPTNR